MGKNITIENGSFIENECESGNGGLMVQNSETIMVEHIDFNNNTGERQGGGVSIFKSKIISFNKI